MNVPTVKVDREGQLKRIFLLSNHGFIIVLVSVVCKADIQRLPRGFHDSLKILFLT